MIESHNGDVWTAEGFLNKQTRSFYPWSIENLIHCCSGKINITSVDFKLNEDNLPTPKIIGQPMPALLPIGVKRFEFCQPSDKLNCLKMLNQYLLYPKFQNLLHLLAIENRPILLHKILSCEPDITRYFPVTRSPIQFATPQCVSIIVGYLTDPHSNAGHLISHFSIKTMLRILALPP